RTAGSRPGPCGPQRTGTKTGPGRQADLPAGRATGSVAVRIGIAAFAVVARQRVVVDRRRQLGRPPPAVATSPAPALAAEPRRQVSITDDARDRLRQGHVIAGRDEEAGLGCEIASVPALDRDKWRAAGHRLEHGQPKALVV